MNVSEVRRIQQFDHLLLGAQDATGCHRMPHIAELTLFGCSDHLEILEVQLLVWECLGRMFSEEIEFFSKGFGLCHKVHMDYRSILSSL